MYDNLWDQSAIIQQMRATSEEKGEIKALRNTVIDTVQVRFPSLLDIAQQTAHSISDAAKLRQLNIQILTASNEENARALFDGKQDD
jgi:hypothetical protein